MTRAEKCRTARAPGYYVHAACLVGGASRLYGPMPAVFNATCTFVPLSMHPSSSAQLPAALCFLNLCMQPLLASLAVALDPEVQLH